MFVLFLACTASEPVVSPAQGVEASPAGAATAIPAEPRTCWAGDDPPDICLAEAWPGVAFTRAVWVGTAPGDPDSTFVLEQDGRIRLLKPGASAAPVWADLTDRVLRKGNEEGLLGMAFHPNYAENRRVFLYYREKAPGKRSTVLVEYKVEGSAPGALDLDSAAILMRIGQPAGNHNGGALAFGPDGRLYLGLGDGGGAGDPRGFGQNTQSVLGSILRVDVDNRAPGSPYGVPSDNPFADGVGGRPELYAWGLRNPWRMDFDPYNGTLWVGDVGQNQYEEIDRVVLGGNYGWNLREGMHCFPGLTCDTEGLIDPVFEYPRRKGVSITGGVVYRGAAVPELAGTYLFADFGTGRVWGLCDGPEGAAGEVAVEELLDSALRVSSFGRDGAGEALLVHFGLQGDGRIYRVLPADSPECDADALD